MVRLVRDGNSRRAWYAVRLRWMKSHARIAALEICGKCVRIVIHLNTQRGQCRGHSPGHPVSETSYPTIFASQGYLWESPSHAQTSLRWTSPRRRLHPLKGRRSRSRSRGCNTRRRGSRSGLFPCRCCRNTEQGGVVVTYHGIDRNTRPSIEADASTKRRGAQAVNTVSHTILILCAGCMHATCRLTPEIHWTARIILARPWNTSVIRAHIALSACAVAYACVPTDAISTLLAELARLRIPTVGVYPTRMNVTSLACPIQARCHEATSGERAFIGFAVVILATSRFAVLELLTAIQHRCREAEKDEPNQKFLHTMLLPRPASLRHDRSTRKS